MGKDVLKMARMLQALPHLHARYQNHKMLVYKSALVDLHSMNSAQLLHIFTR